MTVTIKKKVAEKKLTAPEQNEKDLYWLSSLRQLIPPIGDEQIWKELSPEAARLYILIWALDSAQVTQKKGMPFVGVTVRMLLLRYYKHYEHEFGHALSELLKKKLIKMTDDGSGPPPLAITTIIYNIPVDVLENGINVAQKNEDLLFLRSLRQYLPPPIGSKSKWFYMPKEAFKLYLLIWSLYSAQWASKEHMRYVGVDYIGLEKLSEYDHATFNNTIKDLKKRYLIEHVFTKGVGDNPPDIWCKLTYYHPDDM